MVTKTFMTYEVTTDLCGPQQISVKTPVDYRLEDFLTADFANLNPYRVSYWRKEVLSSDPRHDDAIVKYQLQQVQFKIGELLVALRDGELRTSVFAKIQTLLWYCNMQFISLALKELADVELISNDDDGAI